MIASLRGLCAEIENETALIDVGGIGYEIFASASTLGELQKHLKKTVQIFIYTHVREDQLSLFGFFSKAEKTLFLSLLKVNGIGPKVALNILSGASYERIYEFIENGDAKALSSLPRVGKKTAEQIVLTLKGQLVRVDSEGRGQGSSKNSQLQQQLSFALVNLGFKSTHVESFITSLPADIDFEEGVRRGLAQLSQGV
jgi:Holliday junction DNA helicase RuvA